VTRCGCCGLCVMSHKLEARNLKKEKEKEKERKGPTGAGSDRISSSQSFSKRPTIQSQRPKLPHFDTEREWHIVVIVGFAACRITCVVVPSGFNGTSERGFRFMNSLAQSLVHTSSKPPPSPSGAQFRSKRNMRALKSGAAHII
jgi:hypothetical protein